MSLKTLHQICQEYIKEEVRDDLYLLVKVEALLVKVEALLLVVVVLLIVILLLHYYTLRIQQLELLVALLLEQQKDLNQCRSSNSILPNLHIKRKDRQYLKSKLEELTKNNPTLLQRKSPRRTSITENVDLTKWPYIYDVEDLYEGPFLRSDIRNFLSDRIIGDKKIQIVKDEKTYILITVSSEDSRKQAESLILSVPAEEHCLGPNDIVRFKVGNLPVFKENNEMLSILSGSTLLGKGSIGLLSCNNNNNVQEYFAKPVVTLLDQREQRLWYRVYQWMKTKKVLNWISKHFALMTA